MGRAFSKLRGELIPFALERRGVLAWLHPRVGPELSAAWLAAPAKLVPADGAAETAAWRGRSSDPRWFVKRRVGRKGRRALMRSFAMGLELEDAGLSIPVHLAVLRAKSPSGADTTLLITELLEGEDLDVAFRATTAEERDALLANSARCVAELHTAGFRQRDLKAPNLRVTRDGLVALVDLEGVARGAGPRRREKDLGRLAASFLALSEEEAWTRWVAVYVEARQALGSQELPVAELARRTLQRGIAKVARNRAKGRVLR